jgi:hypothetical protein
MATTSNKLLGRVSLRVQPQNISRSFVIAAEMLADDKKASAGLHVSMLVNDYDTAAR